MGSQKSLIYGRNPVLEALEHDKPLDRILMHHQISGDTIGDILKLAKSKGIPIVRVPIEKLNAMVRVPTRESSLMVRWLHTHLFRM
ncbi:MAG: hypothetical protein IPK62_10485 [Bacteroidetes bacterium]|nr:hypothetical protein [Bacteroidota bacterium]